MDKLAMIVDVFKFSHDTNGNPNALHFLHMFGDNIKTIRVSEKRRKQVGYSDYLDHANYLIDKYTPKGYKEINRIIVGSRSEGCIAINVTLTKE
jgi:hypothetical protein